MAGHWGERKGPEIIYAVPLWVISVALNAVAQRAAPRVAHPHTAKPTAPGAMNTRGLMRTRPGLASSQGPGG